MKRLLAAAAILVLSTGFAAALTAVAESDVNVRSGPGTAYQVIGLLPEGSAVEVAGCGDGWCRVSFRGGSGFVSARYLDMAGAPPAIAAVPEPYYPEPYYDEPYYVPGPIYGPAIGIYSEPSWRYRHYRNRHWRGRHRQQAVGAPGFATQPQRQRRTVGAPGFANQPQMIQRRGSVGARGFAAQPQMNMQGQTVGRRGFADQPAAAAPAAPATTGRPGFANQ
jgi:uncharacterized protein YraI